MGGTLAKYAAEGVEVFLLTATRGDARPLPRPSRRRCPDIPAATRWRQIREARTARRRRGAGRARGLAARLPATSISIGADPPRRRAPSPAHLRRLRPDVVITFGPDGAYGHPDHIAISQFTTAAIVAAADAVTWAFERRRLAKRRMRCRSCTTWRGRRRPGRPIEAAFATTGVDGRRRRAARHAVARLGDHHRDRYAPLSGPRSGGRSRATSRRSPPTSG